MSRKNNDIFVYNVIIVHMKLVEKLY